MSESVLIWLFAGAYALIGVLFALVWQHVIRCKGVGEDIAVIKQIVADTKKEIGDHDTGLRGSIHKLARDISPYVILAQHKLERRE